VIRHLVIDAPEHGRGLAMHQDGGAWIGRRIEPGQALHRPARVSCSMSTNHVASFVLHAFEQQAELFAHRAAAAVAGDQPIGVYAVRAAVLELTVNVPRPDALRPHGAHAGSTSATSTLRLHATAAAWANCSM